MLELFGKRYYDCMRAGTYPQGDVTVDMLHRMAASYNKKFHFAPVWEGHPDDMVPMSEPKALGWVEDLIVIGDVLYFSLAEASDELIELVNKNFYKFISIEIKYYEISGSVTEYLFAAGLTNRPAVKGLSPLEFPKRYTDTQHTINTNFANDNYLKFELNNFTNLNENSMNEFLKKLAASVGIDVAKFTTESSLHDAIELRFTEKNTEIGSLKSELAAFKEKPGTPDETLAARVGELETKLFTQLADGAVASKKILPAQRDFIITSAKADYEGTKKYIDSLPELDVLDQNKVKDGVKKTGDAVNLDDPKFTDKATGKKITYSDAIRNPSLEALFTREELHALRAEDPLYK